MKKNNPINNAGLQMEAQRLYSSVAGISGADEPKLTRIFATRLPCEITVIAQFYTQFVE